jgi:hypothetical protein
MKQLQLSAFFLFISILLNAQPPDNKIIPEGFTAGSIITSDNTTLQGHIKNNMKTKGEVIFLSADGKKTRYTASQLSGLTMERNDYVVANNAFYKLITDGAKIKLLRKASNSPRIEYNGSEPIGVSAGEGVYDDYFIQIVDTKKLQLVRKKDFQKIFTSICADCVPLTEDLKANKISFAEIEQAVALYNTCAK